jgi:UDP-4-amino-4,6-dideoxy-N-acetyl-beta-L-altrosamine transaminase
VTKNPKRYFYGQQFLEEDDFQAVSGALHRRYISQGPSLAEFQDNVAKYCGAGYCLAVSNGTTAIYLACLAAGLGKGDSAWTTALSFVATANAIRLTGATVDFIDIDLATFNLDISQLQQKLELADRNGTLPKILIPVHFAGMSCDMKALHRLSQKYGFLIIEDAAQAMGGDFNGQKIGCCKYSDAAIFSLHPVKSITTGEGGLLVTNNDELFDRALKMRSHGLENWEGPFDDVRGPWHREMTMEGFNFRITEFQCTLGVSQLKKIDRFIAHRTHLAGHYYDRLSEAPVQVQVQSDDCNSAWHMMIILLDLENISKGKLQIFNELEDRFIYPSLHYYPIPLHPFYRKLGYSDGMFPVAEDYYIRAFTMPMHVGLEIQDVDYVCDNLIDILK